MAKNRNAARLVLTTTAMVIAAANIESASQAGDVFKYPRLILQGRLASTFVIDQYEYISGMTCRIALKGGGVLPSQVFFIEFDAAGKQIGRKVRLIYPQLNRGETGKATFRLRSGSPAKVVLRGEWKGPWKDPY
jgi:hypothetical protein